jgi:oligopeptide/dipeptide ABC transporter ATP-binding protein
MYGGKTHEHGDATSVLASPAHPYTRALLRAAMPGAVPAGEDFRLPAEGEVGVSGCPLAPRCPWSRPSCLELEQPIRTPANSDVLCDVPDALPFSPGPHRSAE